MNLLNRYGRCKVNKGTLLFREAPSTDFFGSMFFSLMDLTSANEHSDSNFLQVWNVKREFDLLFMVKAIGYHGEVESAIVDIYNNFFPENICNDDLEIKQRDINRRNSLIRKMQEDGIYGWLSSLEDHIALEICLFPSLVDFQNIIEYQDEFTPESKKYNYYNALNHIDIIPSTEILSKIKLELKRVPFSRYVESREMLIESEMTLGCSYPDAKSKYFGLRDKLEI